MFDLINRNHAELKAEIASLRAHLDLRLDRNRQRQEIIMADAVSILAKITANNDMIASQTAALTALAEGQTSIKAEIDALKAQIAAGTPPDFTALDAAADQQTALVAGAGAAIGANT